MVGCTTLVLACALMGAWVRSLVTFDVINIPLGNEYAIAIASWKEAVAVRVGWDIDDPWREWIWDTMLNDPGYTDPRSTMYRVQRPIPDGSGCFVTWYLLTDRGGIGVSPVNQRAYCRMLFLIHPYWSLVIPLTLVSAYLLLRKPCRRGH